MAIIKDGKSDIADRLRATAEDLVDLVTAQVKLVRVELLADLRAMGVHLARLAIFVPLLVLGYAFLAGAVAWALAPRLGLPLALALIGALHVCIGIWGVVRASRSIGAVRVLDRSREEAERTLEAVVPTAGATPPRLPAKQ
jgi:hypothetical protein